MPASVVLQLTSLGVRLSPSVCRGRLRTRTSCSSFAFTSCLCSGGLQVGLRICLSLRACSGHLSGRSCGHPSVCHPDRSEGCVFPAPAPLQISLSYFNFQLSVFVKQPSAPSPISHSLDFFGVVPCDSSALLSSSAFGVSTRRLRFCTGARHHHSSPQPQRPQKTREGAAPRTQRSLQFLAQRRRLLHHHARRKSYLLWPFDQRRA
jgi:hypothetical protein